MDTGHDNDIGLRFLCLAGKGKAVAPDVGHAMEDFRRLVIMRQDDGVTFPLQASIARISSTKVSHSISGTR